MFSGKGETMDFGTMKRFVPAALVLVALFQLSGCAPKAPKNPLDAVIPAGAKPEKITGDMVFDTAGSPCWVNGVIYFTNNNFDDLAKTRVMKMEKPGDIQVIRQNSGMTATLKLDRGGNFLACEMMGHRIIEMDASGKVLRTVVSEYGGKRIDGPNDIAIDQSGGFYFTDSQFIGTEQKMQDKPAVYYVKTDGTVIRVADGVEFPNGLALTPDGKILYLLNTNGKYILAYDVNADATLSNKRNFAELELSQDNIAKKSEVSGADGMAVDSAGNLFVATTQGLGVQVFDKAGLHLGNIPVPAPANNCAFGGADLKTLFISAKDGIYKMPIVNAGFMFK
jgi:gluconolactonase